MSPHCDFTASRAGFPAKTMTRILPIPGCSWATPLQHHHHHHQKKRARLWKWHQSITALVTVKSCQISNSRGAVWRHMCRSAHKLHPRRVGKKRAADKWDMNSRAMRACWGWGVYWDFNTAELNRFIFASYKCIRLNVASVVWVELLTALVRSFFMFLDLSTFIFSDQHRLFLDTVGSFSLTSFHKRKALWISDNNCCHFWIHNGRLQFNPNHLFPYL